MVWQPRANCWVYHPITNGLYWPKGSAKFANLEQNALKHFLTSAEGRVGGNMFFLYYFFVFPTCFFCSTLFFPKTGTFRNAFFPPFCFVLFLFSPQQQKNVFFLNKEKTCFFQNPTLAEGAGKIYCVLIIAFDVQASAKKKEKEKRKEGTEKKGGRMHSLCQKRRVFFPASLERRKKAKPPGLS